MISRRKYPQRSPRVRLMMIYSVKTKMRTKTIMNQWKMKKNLVKHLIMKSQEKLRRRAIAAATRSSKKTVAVSRLRRKRKAQVRIAKL